MRLVVTADLHYNITRSIEPTRRVAERICGLAADALMILGDVAARDVRIVRDCLRLFDRFTGRKFFVAGNHDIWTNEGADSLERFERILPDVCQEEGFHPLDIEPVVLNRVGLVGSMGWYDFSFRPPELGIPLRFYEAKISPGAAGRLGGYEHLFADQSDIPASAMKIGTRWMDGQHVRLPMSDQAFCHRLLERLTNHLDQVADECDKIVVGMHHVPFEELLPHNPRPGWAFGRAFLGSEAFGQVLLQHPKVRHLFTGHTHRVMRARCGHIEGIDVGCTYINKRYETLEV